jgi:hypothetical protein
MAATTSAVEANGSEARRPPLWLLFVYLVAGILVYLPAFPGGPISDDYGLLLNPFVRDFSPGRVLELLDPGSQATITLRNYAPVRPLIQAVEWQLFGEYGPAYHAVNVAVHALASWLLVRLWMQAGVSLLAGALAGAFFALHPAVVESVAWISQIWGPAAMCFGAGALLAQRRRPALALALFALALLSRPTAVCLLPVAGLREWAWRREPDDPEGQALRALPGAGGRTLWIAGWVLAAAALAVVEMGVFRDSGAAAQAPLHPDAWVRGRTIFATAGRYLAMAATGFGVSAFHEPRPALSWLDPWWLLGLAAAIALGARGLWCLVRGREEAAFWAWAPAAFVPVSQLFPFLYPMADRYLYFILPGLLGGALLFGGERLGRLDPARRRLAMRATAAAAAVAIAGFAAWSHQRAGLWVAEDLVLADAASHYPDGVAAHLLRARSAAAQGDVDAVIASIEVCRARGWDYYGYLLSHPAFEPVRNHERIRALIRDFAGQRIESASRRGRLTQLDLRDLADAHRQRGEWEQAVAMLERAIALGGPLDAELGPALALARKQADRAAGRGEPQRTVDPTEPGGPR